MSFPQVENISWVPPPLNRHTQSHSQIGAFVFCLSMSFRTENAKNAVNKLSWKQHSRQTNFIDSWLCLCVALLFEALKPIERHKADKSDRKSMRLTYANAFTILCKVYKKQLIYCVKNAHKRPTQKSEASTVNVENLIRNNNLL